MAIRLIGPGPSPRTGGWAGLAEALEKGVSNYQTAKESAEEKALKAMLLRGELTGSLYDVPGGNARIASGLAESPAAVALNPEAQARPRAGFRPVELGALRSLGISDPSTVQPTEAGRKVAGIRSAAQTMGLNVDQTAMEKVYLKSLGLELPDPAEEIAKIEKGFAAASKMSEGMGLPDSPPPHSLIQQWEKASGQPWPTITKVDPVTGQPITRPASYKQAEDMKPEKIQNLVQETLKMATKRDFMDHPFMTPAQARQLIESQVAYRLGDDWRLKHQDVAEMVDQAVQAHGLSESATAPSLSPSAPSVTPAQRSLYNMAREQGKSQEEARAIAGF